MDTKFLQCPTCQRINVAISEAAAAEEVAGMTEYLASLPDAVRLSDYSGRTPSLDNYRRFP